MNELIADYKSPTAVLTADWVLPVSAAPIENGAVAIAAEKIIRVGERDAVSREFPRAIVRDFGEAAILPGFVNTHTHLELTAMRGFLDQHENEFSKWLLTLARTRDNLFSPEDLENSALCGAIEATRAGVTCIADIGKHGFAAARALRETGLRGVSFQENSFAMDANRAPEFFREIIEKLEYSKQFASDRVLLGITPHAPYTVSAPLFELITDYAVQKNLKITIHVAESRAELELMQTGTGNIANVLANLNINWNQPRTSSVRYLHDLGVLKCAPLLAHCVNVDAEDLEIIRETNTKIAHCPKSNTKFAHGVAPFAEMLAESVKVGLGSDSVASNNVCDLLEEARFAALAQRARGRFVDANSVLRAATLGGAESLGMETEIGSLEAGKSADLCVVSLDSIAQQPIYSPEAALIFASSAQNIVLTMVAGETIFEAGAMQTVDETAARRKLRETREKIIKQI